MFREVVRKKKIIPMEDCIHLLKTETRGVLSVLGDRAYDWKTSQRSLETILSR